MAAGASDQDAYLAGWRRNEAQEHPGGVSSVLAEVLADLESAYSALTLSELVRLGGRNPA